MVDSTCTLTIDAGVRIYMHYGSYFEVKGKLIINGTAQDSVVFKGDRLEEEYSEIPGQWGGIVIFRKSTGSILTHAIIDEPNYGIIIGSFQTDTNVLDYSLVNEPRVILNECIIKDCLQDGIYSTFSTVNATNSLIYSCGMYNVGLFYGGNYNFYSCTLVDSNSAYISHSYPVVAFSNYFRTNSYSALTAYFYNTIVYGDISNGNEIDTGSVPNTGFTYLFQNCLISTKLPTPLSRYSANLVNENPFFVNPPGENYHLESNSPCIGKGGAFEPSTDLDGYPRNGSPDIGCYEYH